MIKLNMYVLLFAVSTWTFQSCDNNDDDNISISKELQQIFSSKYPDANHVKWEAKGQYYVADFLDKSYDASAWYSANGQWYMTETDVPYSAIPASIKASFEAIEYSKTPWRMDDVDKLERQDMETVYVIEVENKDQEIDLYYSEDGILIKTIVDVEDDDSQGYLPSTQLSAAMISFIESKYVGAKIVEVDIEDDRLDPEYGFTEVDIVHNGINKDLLFDKKGNWFSTSEEKRIESLPIEVKNAVSILHPSYRIDDAYLYEKPNDIIYYLLELESNRMPDKKVTFLPDGNIYI